MPADYLTVESVTAAAAALQEGLLVAFPTETVYGLGADAGNLAAIKRLYAAKGRPADHPVIVHIHEAAQLAELASCVPEPAEILAQRFWPGPLTMVLPCAAHVRREITGGQDTVAVRIPNHPVALQLLREFGKPVVAPSANRFGRLSPTTAADVRAEFKDEVAVILDGGPCNVGVESTIVDLSGARPRILRPGMILQQDIEAALGVPVELVLSPEHADVKVPGSLKRHYAPSTLLMLADGEDLAACISALAGKKFSVLCFSDQQHFAGSANAAQHTNATQHANAALQWITAPRDPFAYARNLYAYLHQLDGLGGDVLIVEKVPNTPEWTAIRDRLQRAAAQPL